MTSRLAVALLSALAVLLGSAENAYACSCVGPNPACQAVWQAGAVFTGEVVSVTVVERTIEGQPTLAFRGRRARIRVLESFRGTPGAEVDVFTGAGGGDCGFGFVQGGRYLIYAYRESNGLATGICTRTALLAKATEDLEYLRGPAQNPSVFGRIFGRAERQVPAGESDSQPDQSPDSGARITVTGGGKVFRATTAADGRYEVRVPPGEYEVSADVADGWYATVSFPKAQVLDTRGCAQSDVFVRPDGRISGRVEDGDGRPVAGLSVELLPVRAARESYVAPHFAIRTDESGRYEFTRLPPGRYYLGSTLRRQPGESLPAPLFYPGVRTIAAAKEIPLGVSERRPLDAFVVPTSYGVVRIQGLVRLPDGRPAANVKVYLKGGVKEYPLFGEAVTTGTDGRFSLLAAAGHAYRLAAEQLVDGRVAASIDSGPFNGEGDLAPFVLRLVPVKPPGR